LFGGTINLLQLSLILVDRRPRVLDEYRDGRIKSALHRHFSGPVLAEDANIANNPTRGEGRPGRVKNNGNIACA
jgi:hypothetical protein